MSDLRFTLWAALLLAGVAFVAAAVCAAAGWLQ